MPRRGPRRPGLRRRPGGSWEMPIAYRDPDTGRRVRWSRSFRTAQEAVDYYDAVMARVRAGEQRRDEAQTVGELIDRWIEHGRTAKHWSPSHLRRTQAVVRYLSPIREVRVNRLRVSHVEAVLGEMQNLSADSRRLLRSALSAALMLDMRDRDRVATTNVARLAELAPAPDRPPRFIPPERLPDFIAALDGCYLRPFYLTATLLALRPGEAVGLRWRDLDLQRGAARIERSVQYINGVGYVERPWPKDREARRVAIPDMLLDVLREHRQAVSELSRLRPDSPVFSGVRGGWVHEPWANRHLRGVVDDWNRRRAEALGRELEPDEALPRVTMYQLRHTGGTLMRRTGTPLEVIRDAMGHSTVRMTERYAHGVPAEQREAAERLDGFLTTAIRSRDGSADGSEAPVG